MGVHGRNGIPSPLSIDTPADAPCTLEEAREYLAGCALRPTRLGTVGLELERHVVDLRRPGAVVSWRRLCAAVAGVRLPAASRLTMEPGGQV